MYNKQSTKQTRVQAWLTTSLPPLVTYYPIGRKTLQNSALHVFIHTHNASRFLRYWPPWLTSTGLEGDVCAGDVVLLVWVHPQLIFRPLHQTSQLNVGLMFNWHALPRLVTFREGRGHTRGQTPIKCRRLGGMPVSPKLHRSTTPMHNSSPAAASMRCMGHA